ncbi:cytochrome b/b6 domain-containing protein [Aliiroseovarius sediminis]|uniref:cytochrome b/b6 domain-containing protein n=1 Tax=Aliiroseovarius sediminis TaxID=2925839 RepID=UPI001F588B27|nr:cytochrome b/b6 domain-containing protein [Aliiroseovarius sediminis]MCI2395715.1 cytochrome b/b6 domain-containing protein [Aliiroseovarius sediminis]
MIRVWDPLVRLVHWSLVVAFAIAWLTGDESESWHIWAGYAAAGLIGLRLIWGLVGPRYARFSQFVRGPGTVTRYLRDMLRGREARYVGHNPAGAVMVLALLVTLSATAFTGWLMVEPARMAYLPDLAQFVSPAFADDNAKRGGDEEALEEVHEMLANLLLVLVVLHIAGVILASRRHHENLPRAMITGRKRAPSPEDIA